MYAALIHHLMFQLVILIDVYVCDFRMPTPQMDGSARSELQELQVKSNQVADEVNIN